MSTVSPENTPLLQRPYIDRQMIVVVDDTVAESALKVEYEAQDKEDTVNLPSAVAFAIGGIVGLATAEIVKSSNRVRSDGIRLFHVGKSESLQLDFPPGHPRDKVVYVGHPAKPTVYYTVADFHRVTFEHKFSEAIDLLMHLGATTIKVEHVRGWSREFAANLSVPLGSVDARVETGTQSDSRARLLFEATLSGDTEPELPDGLVWYPHEPTWQSVANGRLRFGLHDFSLSVSYEDDFGVHAGLKASTLKAGLEIGGKFEDHEATTWKISGEFRAP